MRCFLLLLLFFLFLPQPVFSESDRETKAIRLALSANRNGFAMTGLQALLEVVNSSADPSLKVRYFLAKQYVLMLEEKGFPEDKDRLAAILRLDQELYYLEEAISRSRHESDGVNLIQGVPDLRQRRKSFVLPVIPDTGYGMDLVSHLMDSQTEFGSCGGGGLRPDAYRCILVTIHKTLKSSEDGLAGPLLGGAAKALFRYPYHPRLFAEEWNRADHQTVLGFRPEHLDTDHAKGVKTALKAPVGSIVVWGRCEGDGRGHIAMVTRPREACSSYCAPIESMCPLRDSRSNQQIIGVFVPTARPLAQFGE